MANATAHDFFDTEIEAGDVIAYPVRHGSSMYLRSGVVVEVDPNIKERSRWDNTERRYVTTTEEQPQLKVLTTSSRWDDDEGEYVDTTRIVTIQRIDNVVRVPEATGAKRDGVQELLDEYASRNSVEEGSAESPEDPEDAPGYVPELDDDYDPADEEV